MKKSFLNRAMAAAIAVPVALSQTVLFASFAEDKVPVTGTIDVQTFINVPVEDSKASPITEVTKYEVYEKESTWNQSLRTALNSLDGTVKELDAEAIINQVGRLDGKWYAEIVKSAATVTAEVKGTDVILTLDVAFTQSEKDTLENKVINSVIGNSSIEKEDLKKYVTSDVLDTTTGKIVITVDTTSLDSDKAVSFKVTATTDTGSVTTLEDAEDYVNGKIESYRAELKADAQKLVDHYRTKAAAATTDAAREYALGQVADAEHLLNVSVDDFADRYLKTATKYENKADRFINKNVTVSYTEASYDDVLRKALDDADARTSDTSRAGKLVNKVPETVSELLNQNTVLKVYTEALRQLNDVANTKGYEVAITTGDIADVAEQAYDVTFDATYSDAAVDGVTTCLLPDDLDDLSYYYTYFNDLLKADGITDKEVDTITTEKKLELSGNADYDTLSGEGTLSVKRIIYITLKDVEETESDSESDSDSDTDTDTDATESDSDTDTDTDATESDSDTDTDTDSSESDSDTDTDTDSSESDSDTDTDTDSSESDSDTDTDTDATESDSDTDTDTDATESDSDTDTDTDASESDSETGSDATESDSETGSDATESDSETGTDATESDSETGSDATESDSETGTDVTESDSETGTDVTESDSETGTDVTESDSETGTDVTESDSETGTDVTESDSETGTDVTESDSETGTDATESDSETGTDATESDSESETDSETDRVKDFNLTVDGDVDSNRNFYFSHDPRPFSPEDLIKGATLTEKVVVDGVETTQEVELDKTKFAFGLTDSVYDKNLSPLDVVNKYKADNQSFAYAFIPLYIFYVDDDGSYTVADKQVYVYIGVKGDANLDGISDAGDAANVLVYAAADGAGLENVYLYSDSNVAAEAFAWFLADVDGESKDKGATSNREGDAKSMLDAGDAAYILIQAALDGSGQSADWGNDVLPEPWPLYTKEITTWINDNQNNQTA